MGVEGGAWAGWQTDRYHSVGVHRPPTECLVSAGANRKPLFRFPPVADLRSIAYHLSFDPGSLKA